MNDEHSWAARKLPLGGAGILDEAAESKLLAHINDCEECRARWAEFAEDAAEPGEHLPATVLARWPESRRELSELEIELAGRHLERCEECREDLALRRSRSSRPSVRRRRMLPGFSGGFAIGAVAAAIALFFFWPREASEPLQPLGGAVPWAVPSQLRGPDATEVAAGARELALSLATPMDFDPTRPAQALVYDPDGLELLSARIAAEQIARTSILVLVRSARPLPEGEYVVELHQEGAAPVVLRFGLVHAAP